MKSPSPLRRCAVTVAAMTLALLTACGSSTPQNNTGQPGNTDVATGGKSFNEADKETAALGSEAAPGQFPRTVKHAEGTTEIKARPQRVVALDTDAVDDLVSLGIKPVGMTTSKGANPIPDYLVPLVGQVQTVGELNQPNLEAIAALKPDLILSSKLRHDKLYPQLSQIAPTVFSIRPGFTWKGNFSLVADSIGEETRAEQVMGEYQKHVAELKNQVGGDKTISLVRFMPGKIRLYGNKSLIGVILTDAGLKRPQKQNIDELAAEISAENISEADGDLLFWTSYGTPDATGETSVIQSTGWKNLSAVSSGHAHRVNDDTWFLGLGPTGANLIVKDLKQLVAG